MRREHSYQSMRREHSNTTSGGETWMDHLQEGSLIIKVRRWHKHLGISRLHLNRRGACVCFLVQLPKRNLDLSAK